MLRIAALPIAALLVACGSEPAERPPRAAHDPAAPAARAKAFECGARTVTGRGIGALRIGMPADSVKSRCRVVRDTIAPDVEGMPARRLTVVLATDTIVAEIDSGRVWRMQITRAGLRTTDSIAVGTPLARLLSLPDVRAFPGEGGVFAVSPAHCGLSFELSERPPRLAPELTAEALRGFPVTTVVSRILVLGCRREGGGA